MTVEMPESIFIRYRDFIRDSESHLDAALSFLLSNRDQIVSNGRWHPTGFAVYNVLNIPGVGLARLHYWPTRTRKMAEFHPTIHRHCFHLRSRVLQGKYNETQHHVLPTQSSNIVKTKQTPTWTGFKVVPPTGDGMDRLEDDGISYDVKSISESTRYFTGETHEMPAGAYHSTEIPLGVSCITLALLSRPILGQSDHLVGEACSKNLVYFRPIVEERVGEELKGLLLDVTVP